MRKRSLRLCASWWVVTPPQVTPLFHKSFSYRFQWCSQIFSKLFLSFSCEFWPLWNILSLYTLQIFKRKRVVLIFRSRTFCCVSLQLADENAKVSRASCRKSPSQTILLFPCRRCTYCIFSIIKVFKQTIPKGWFLTKTFWVEF